MKPNLSTDGSNDNWATELSRNVSRSAKLSGSSSEDDYAIPPDAYGQMPDRVGSGVEVLDMDESLLDLGDSNEFLHVSIDRLICHLEFSTWA